MEDYRRKGKAHAVGNAARIGRHFRAMSMAMEDGEETYERHSCENRGLGPERHRKAEDHDRQRNTGFDERDFYARHAKRAARGHQRDKARGDRIDRPAPELDGQHADEHHCEYVVEAADGMFETLEEARCRAVAGMRKRQRRDE